MAAYRDRPAVSTATAVLTVAADVDATVVVRGGATSHAAPAERS